MLRCGMDCLLGSLRCMARGPSEHVALQKGMTSLGCMTLLKAIGVLNWDLTFVLAWLKVESVVQKRQYELRAQFMRLCGRQSMMSDARRAGANLLQNQIKSFFMTQRVELFSSKKKLKELNLSIMTQRIASFFDMTQRIEYFFMKNNSRIEPFFFLQTTQRIELFFFLTKRRLKVFFQEKWLKEFNSFFFEHDSKNWSSFFFWYGSKIFLNMTLRFF